MVWFLVEMVIQINN